MLPAFGGEPLGAAAPVAAPSRSDLERSYALCRENARVHSKTFYFASLFLPAEKKRAIWAAYAFCRTADDYVDSFAPAAQRLASLDAWEHALREAYAGRANEPLLLAYADAAERFSIPIEPALDLLRGARRDITIRRYETYDELREYCYLVASTVGLLTAPILGYEDGALPYGIALGRAMQMTNILRDVGEDARMDRIYLPAEDLERFGCTEEAILRGVVDAGFVRMMKFQIERVRRMYADAEPGIALLGAESRYTVRVALTLYRRILERIEQNGYDVFSRRAFVPIRTKIAVALASALRHPGNLPAEQDFPKSCDKRLGVSSLLADMLRKSRSAYNDMWIDRSRTGFATEPKAEVVSQHLTYWDTICSAVESNEFGELLQSSRDAGKYQAMMGMELADAVNRTVSATNMIEIALLESSDGETSPIDVIGEIADLRSMIVMAVVEGYKSATSEATKQKSSNDRLRAALLADPERFTPIDLPAGDELGPLYDADLRFYAVASGKIRLYNLLSNGRTITLSILSENDVFFQWKAQSASLSVVCAEAMQDSRIVGVSEKDLVQLLGEQPAAAIDVIQNFARRLTESQALIDDLMNNSVNLLLYRTLAELARQFGRDAGGSRAGAVIIDVPLTHQRLADMIGSNRVTVTRKLHELQQRGLIVARGSGSIEVVDLAALNRLVANAEA